MKEILEIEKALDTFHALNEINMVEESEEDHWAILENTKLHRDQTYPVYSTIEEWIGLPKYLPQILDYGVPYYC